MSKADHPLAKLVNKLASRGALAAEDEAAILALPYVIRTYAPGSFIIQESAAAQHYCSFVLSGFAYGQKRTVEAVRQIVSLHLPGDILDLQNLFLTRADHNVQALRKLEAAEIGCGALRALAADRPAVAQAMWVDALVDASVFREWVVNVGRRDARTRIAHLLCEFATRMRAAGLNEGDHHEFPMTQKQIGDATGLSVVHVNRTLKSLATDGVVHLGKTYVSFTDWKIARSIGDFSASYLHLDQAQPPAH